MPSAPPCPLCRSTDAEPWALATDLEYRTTDEPFRYMHCRPCDVLFIDPVPTDRLHAIYPANYYAFSGSGASAIERVKQSLDARRFRRLLRGLPGESLAALDIGGGTGSLLDVVRSADPRVRRTQVVDIDAGATGLAASRGHDAFCGRIEDFTSQDQFDFILVLNLIEHVADPAAVLCRIAQLLTPTGLALVKTPNFRSLDARIFRHRNWSGYHCPRHWVLFELAGFSRLAHACGLTLRERSYTQGAPFWAGSALFELARLGLLTISAQRPVCTHPLYGGLCGLFAAFDLARIPFGGTPSQMVLTLARRA